MMREKDGNGQRDGVDGNVKERWFDNFYQIQRGCDLTLGQSYLTSQKVKCALKWVPLGYLDALVSI
jgi:hypothetical protein